MGEVDLACPTDIVVLEMHSVEPRDGVLAVIGVRGEVLAWLPDVAEWAPVPFVGADVVVSPDGAWLAVLLRTELGGLGFLVDGSDPRRMARPLGPPIDTSRGAALRWIDGRRLQILHRPVDEDVGRWFSVDAPTGAWLSVDGDAPRPVTPVSQAYARAYLDPLAAAASLQPPAEAVDAVTRIVDRRRAARALYLVDPRDLERAVTLTRRALALAPDWHRARLAWARALGAAGRHAEMLDACAAWVAADPADGRLWVALAAARMHQGDVDGSLVALRTAAERLPDVTQWVHAFVEDPAFADLL